MRIIPQGRAFISHLLTIASSVSALLSPVYLDSPSRAELRLWLHILSNWNGISFFYEEQLSHLEDINLFTDAAPSVGFGGFYMGNGLQLHGLQSYPTNPSSSTALFKIYPVVAAAVLWGHTWSCSRSSYTPTTWPS